MNRQAIRVFITFCMIGLACAAVARGGNMLTTGTMAPDFTAKTIDGTELTLSKTLAEHPVVLVFIRGFG